MIGSDQTATAVELDQIFAIFDERTRTGLQDFFKGSAEMLHGRGKELRRGVHYLNPAFSTGSRLFAGAHPRRGAARELPRGLRDAS